MYICNTFASSCLFSLKPFFSPPYGAINEDIANYIKTNYAMNIVTWDIDSADTSSTPAALTPQGQYNFYQTLSYDGGQQLPHMPLSHETNTWSPGALELGIGTPQMLRNAGYELLTIADCMDDSEPYVRVNDGFGTRDDTWTCDSVFTPTQVGSSSTPSPTCAQTYISAPNDNCDSIANHFGLTHAQILAANTLVIPLTLQLCRILLI
jgi:LysM repeat protein